MQLFCGSPSHTTPATRVQSAPSASSIDRPRETRLQSLTAWMAIEEDVPLQTEGWMSDTLRHHDPIHQSKQTPRCQAQASGQGAMDSRRQGGSTRGALTQSKCMARLEVGKLRRSTAGREARATTTHSALHWKSRCHTISGGASQSGQSTDSTTYPASDARTRVQTVSQKRAVAIDL